MSDEKLEEYLRVVEPKFNSHLEKGTIEMNNEYYNLLEERMARLINKNKELKNQIEEYQLQNINLRADIMIQKMAFPNKLIKDKTFYNLYDMSTYEELLVQQKEFIKYLEDESKEIYRDGGLRQNIFRQILQKYKEITGVSDEKK